MLSSYSRNQQLPSSRHNNAFPHPYNFPEQYSKPSPLPSNQYHHTPSTQNSHSAPKSTTGSHPQKESTNLPQTPVNYPTLNSTNHIPSLNVKRPGSFNNLPEQQIQKKVKTEKECPANLFADPFRQLDFTDNSERISGTVHRSLQDTESNLLLDSKLKESLGSFKIEDDDSFEDPQLYKRLRSAVDLLKDDFKEKGEVIKDGNYFLQINFDFPGKIRNTNHPESFPSSSAGKTEDSRNTQLAIPKEKQEVYQAIKKSLDAVSESDMERLLPEKKLNDNLINFYLNFIENSLPPERKKRCYFFNTYFMAQLGRLFNDIKKEIRDFDQIYEKMKRWTKKVYIFDYDFVFLPVNDNDHWNLLILCYPARFITQLGTPFVLFLDSLSRMEHSYAIMVDQYFKREAMSKMLPSQAKDFQNSWRNKAFCLPFYQSMLPKQNNKIDCGLYLLQYVELFAEDETYLTSNLEEVDKTKWFPRKLIEEKKKDIQMIIEQIRKNNFGVISQYQQKKNKILQQYRNDPSQYDNYNPYGYEKELREIYKDNPLNDQDKRCLMIDYYFHETLNFDEFGRKRTKKSPQL